MNIKINNIFIGLSAFFFFACSESEDIDQASSLEYETVILDNGDELNLILDSEFSQATISFDSEDELNVYIDKLEEASDGEIRLNKEIYQTLKHYLDPFEISLINADFQLDVGGKRYKFDKVATYELDLTNSWELSFYHGEEGNVHDEELFQVLMNRDQLDVLKNHKFKSPAARKRYEELKTVYNNPNGRMAESRGFFLLTSSNYSGSEFSIYTGTDENQAYRLNYFGTDAATVVQCISRANVANEEYANPFTRASGGTSLQVKDLTTNKGRYSTSVWTQPLTLHLSGFQAGDVQPYCYVKVYSRDWREDFGDGWYAFRTGIRRRGGQLVHSRHRIHYRPNGSTTRREIFHLARWD